MNQATLQPSKVLIEAGFISKAYLNKKAFLTPIGYAENLCWYHMHKKIKKNQMYLLTSDSFTKLCDIFSKLQDLHNCCIFIIILRINIFSARKHLFDIQEVYI